MDSHGLMRHYNPQGDKELNKDGSELWIFRNMGFSIAVQFGLGKSLSGDVDKGRATMKESGCWGRRWREGEARDWRGEKRSAEQREEAFDSARDGRGKKRLETQMTNEVMKIRSHAYFTACKRKTSLRRRTVRSHTSTRTCIKRHWKGQEKSASPKCPYRSTFPTQLLTCVFHFHFNSFFKPSGYFKQQATANLSTLP